MKKFWQAVSKKDLIFGVLMFAMVLVISFFDSARDVKVEFGDAAVDITSKRYSMNIPYEMVDRSELVDMPDKGSMIEGNDDMTLRTGLWANETWGEYYVCADLDATNCIVVHLDNNKVFVFSCKDVKKTAEIYTTLQGYLNQ